MKLTRYLAFLAISILFVSGSARATTLLFDTPVSPSFPGAVYAYGVNGLNVNGEYFDVRFETQAGGYEFGTSADNSSSIIAARDALASFFMSENVLGVLNSQGSNLIVQKIALPYFIDDTTGISSSKFMVGDLWSGTSVVWQAGSGTLNAGSGVESSALSDPYGNFLFAQFTPSPVPLPAAFPLMLSGLGVLGFASRRKTKQV